MNGAEAMRDLFRDVDLCPTAVLCKPMVFGGNLFTDFRTPGIVVVALNVREHASVGVGGGVTAGDELAESVLTEIIDGAGGFVEALGFEAKSSSWTIAT